MAFSSLQETKNTGKVKWLLNNGKRQNQRHALSLDLVFPDAIWRENVRLSGT
jgi:hypothetical protein